MADTLKHRKQTALATSGADVDKNEWNDTHVLAGGTDGQFMQRDSAQPDGWKWATVTVPAAGGTVPLESHTVSGASAFTFTTRNASGASGATFQSDYDEYILELVGVTPSTNTNIDMRVSTDGGSTFDATNYNANTTFAWTALGSGANVTTAIRLVSALNATANLGGLNGHLRLFNPTSTSVHKNAIGDFVYHDTNVNTVTRAMVQARYTATTAINAFNVFPGSGTITGTIRLYGVKLF